MNNINTIDVSDAIEEIEFEETKEKRSVMKMIQQFATLSQVLRTIGAFSVIASMSIFLLQDWNNGSDLHRYYLLLSQSVLLAIGGFSMAFLLKENKGARVFFGLSLISIAANLTTLGALIFSHVQWGGELTYYPDIAHWTVSSGSSVAIALGIAAIILIPITIFGFKVMARQSAIPLTAAYLVSNSMLLLPVRDTLFVSLIAGASILFLLSFVSKLVKKDPKLRTAEGKFARILLFVAPIIMLVRSLWLYQADELIYTIIAFTGYMTLRHCSLQLDIESQLRKVTEFFSIPTAFAVAVSASQLFDKDFAIPAFALIFTAHMIEFARRSTKEYKGGALLLAGLVTSISFIVHLSIYDTLLSGILCLLAGMFVMAIGYFNNSKAVTFFGLSTTIVATIYDISHIFEIIDLFSWSSLATIGISAIIIGSVIERHGVAIKLRIDNAFKKAEVN
jgi:hypothetical protein